MWASGRARSNRAGEGFTGRTCVERTLSCLPARSLLSRYPWTAWIWLLSRYPWTAWIWQFDFPVRPTAAPKLAPKVPPPPDGGFAADLSKSAAKTRGGHRNAGNKQLHEAMKRDPKLRREMEERHGSDVFERTSTSGAGRKNPKGTEWDHDNHDPNKLHLRTVENHRAKSRAEGDYTKGGGYAKFKKRP